GSARKREDGDAHGSAQKRGTGTHTGLPRNGGRGRICPFSALRTRAHSADGLVSSLPRREAFTTSATAVPAPNEICSEPSNCQHSTGLVRKSGGGRAFPDRNSLSGADLCG